MACDYPYAQWFEAPPPCRVCGKPAGVLRSIFGNANLAYMCRKHADKAIKDAHRKGKFHPDACLNEAHADAAPRADGTGG